NTSTGFVAASDSSSAVSTTILVDHAGSDGSRAARLQFHLGPISPQHPHVYCALSEFRKRDLSGYNGIVVSLRGDGNYRMWLQIRDTNPASTDEGTEWWFTSVKATPVWRRI